MNGRVERLHQEIGQHLRSYCFWKQHPWSKFILWTEYGQNDLIHSPTGLTLIRCVVGCQPPLVLMVWGTTTCPSCRQLVLAQPKCLGKCSRLATKGSETPTYAGQSIPPPSSIPTPSTGMAVNQELETPSHTLFKILWQVYPVTYSLGPPPFYQITFHVSLLKSAHDNQKKDTTSNAPPPPLDSRRLILSIFCKRNSRLQVNEGVSPVSCGLGELWPRGEILGEIVDPTQ